MLDSLIHPVEQDDLKEHLEITRSDTTIRSNALFQRWYRFKEAFSTQLVDEVIEELGFRPKHVADPFGGSGTTALTCSFRGISCTTIEVNPFLADLIKAKNETYSVADVQDHLQLMAAYLDAGDIPVTKQNMDYLPKTFVEPGDKGRWLYPYSVARRIFEYRFAIEKLKNPAIQRLFRIVLASSLVPCSNVLISGKGRRYRRNWEERQSTPADLDRIFFERIDDVLSDIIQASGKTRVAPTVLSGDARVVSGEIEESIDLVLFSPPYPNSFDYTDVYNVELWMLGYLNAPTDNTSLRNQTLRSHVQILRDYNLPEQESRTLKQVLKKLEKQKSLLWSPHIPAMIGSYFADLLVIMNNLNQRLSKKGKMVIIVGDSRYVEVDIPVGKILADFAPTIGLKVDDLTSARSMRTSPQHGGRKELHEWKITLSKA